MQLRVMPRSLASAGMALILSGAILVFGTATSFASNQSPVLDPGVTGPRISLSSREILEFLFRAYKPDEVVDGSKLSLNTSEIKYLEWNLFFPVEEHVDHSTSPGLLLLYADIDLQGADRDIIY